MLCDRFDSIDFNSAKDDLNGFIDDLRELDIWSAVYFKSITMNLKESERHRLDIVEGDF